jgi:tRNA(Ile)-lysidine synthase
MQFNDFRYFCIIMLEKLRQYIAQKELLKPHDRLLLAISGGVDSMVMLSLFQQLPYEIAVAHVNFGLRGTESDGDEEFIRHYCLQHQLTLYTHHANTKEYALQHKVSIQMAAREIRYKWFKEIQQQHQYTKLLVAQHTDDSIETTFINIIRGTGISGLKGVVTNEIAVRPMLCFNRKGIQEYALQNAIEWREDSSNAKNDYLRNKLRNTILPMFDEISDTWRDAVIKLNKDVEESEAILSAYYETNVSTIYNANYIFIDKVKELEFGFWLLRRVLISLGFSHDTISDIVNSLDIQKGKYFESEYYKITKEENCFYVEQKLFHPKNRIDLELHTATDEFQIDSIQYKIEQLDVSVFDNVYTPGENYVDADKLIFPIKIRNWRAGDAFRPLGMKGSKKLSDYFVDKKFTIQQKENTFVIVSGDDIVCILGHQTDDRYKIEATTSRIYHIKSKNG